MKLPTPDEKASRENFLKEVREAKSLAELKNIKWRQPNAEKWLHTADCPKDLSSDEYWQFALLLTQAKELRKQRDWLAHRVELLKTYHSPKWDEVWTEPCPIKEAELRREAEKEDARINELRRKERDPFAGFSEILGKMKRRPWKHRDRSGRDLSFRPAVWHEPMSVMDYHKATGLTRRTIQNMLDRLKARPIAPRKRLNQPFFYDQKINSAILCGWVVRYIKDPHARRGLLARTLLHCQHETPQHYPQLKKAIQPVLETLNDLKEDFDDYLEKSKRLLYPPYEPSSLDKLFGISDLLQLDSGPG